VTFTIPTSGSLNPENTYGPAPDPLTFVAVLLLPTKDVAFTLLTGSVKNYAYFRDVQS
jgi:hypothetical protein